MKPRALALLFGLFGLLLTLQAGPTSAETAPSTSTVTYTASTEQFANPERGFYHFLDKYSTDNTTWWAPALADWRINEGITLSYCVFVLDTFKTTPISNTFLTTIQNNLNAVRDAGLKCILRFAYTYSPSPDNNMDGEPDPPYGDASKAQVMAHITQLEPIIQANSDIILVWQAGFIGIWGEWYYTDYFLEPSSLNPAAPTPWLISDAMHANRYEVLSSMLDVLPDSRMVQVRYPHAKIAMLDESNPLSAASAFDGSNRARIGFHNDCFLAGPQDFGTFLGASDRTFMASETQFVPMGGETCNVNPPRSECPTALLELAQFHYSYLNIDYQLDVLQSWRDGGCFDAIEQALGYRLALTNGTYQDSVRPGDVLDVAINLVNSGYAAPINPRPVKVVLSGANGEFSAELNTDIRTWSPESNPISLTETILVPNCIPAGTYDLLLHLPDDAPTLATRPEYAIRLANTSIWQPTTGMNDLGIDITVTPSASINNSAFTTAFGSTACMPTAIAILANTTASSSTPIISLLLFALAGTIILIYWVKTDH